MVVSLAFVAEGRRVLAGGGVNLGEIAMFDIAGTEPPRRVAFPDGWGRFAVDAPGNRAIVGGYNGSLSVFSLTDLSAVRRVKGHEGIAWSLALSPNGKLLATGGSDRLVVLRDAETLEPLLTFPAWPGVIKSIAFDRSGTRLAYAGIDPDVQTWDLGLVHDELSAVGLAWDQAAPAVTSTTDLATAGERSGPRSRSSGPMTVTTTGRIPIERRSLVYSFGESEEREGPQGSRPARGERPRGGGPRARAGRRTASPPHDRRKTASIRPER